MTFVNGLVKVGKISMRVHTVAFLLKRSHLIFSNRQSTDYQKDIKKDQKITLFYIYKFIQSIWSAIWHCISRILNKSMAEK